MKRRNGDCGKSRKALKRNKSSAEGIYWSLIHYLKLFGIWFVLILLDYLLHFRFEYVWPFWLLFHRILEGFKHQGFVYTVFFVCIALTSDMVCFFFIPVHWLLFAASTYFWVQYIYQAEKCVSWPAVALLVLYIYVETSVRLNNPDHIPYKLVFCKPLAANCIGYPVITLCFGFKSYLSHKLKQKQQQRVSKENEFYQNLLLDALPIDKITGSIIPSQENNDGEMWLESICEVPTDENDVHSNKIMSNGSVPCKKPEKQDTACADVSNKKLVSNDKLVYNNHENHVIKETEKNKRVTRMSSAKNNNHIKYNNQNPSIKEHSKSKGSSPPRLESSLIIDPKDIYCETLENELKRLKSELHTYTQSEKDLRNQLNAALSDYTSVSHDLIRLKQEHEDTKSKVFNLLMTHQNDKQMVSQLEKRLADEKRQRLSCESQLVSERRQLKKVEELAASRLSALNSKPECTESCKTRRRELENEAKSLRKELRLKDDQYLAIQKEVNELQPYKQSQDKIDFVMSALSTLKDKNAHLEHSLSAETRIKLDLFSALGEAKRQLEIKINRISCQEKEIEELKSKMAQTMVMMPPNGTYHIGNSVGNSPTMRFGGSSSPQSSLDPNASIYTPKKNSHLVTEA
ncbi:macoilin-1 [Daktulosphaira vitifoliae]|uniref:macoilin-1 n=1 Tax=Daktulosphaira vitifoliae TaxID=58002 RepID=UPI0021A9FB76|nr:macoilin-1 [Daktulosphaira vitifoliae]